MKHNPVKTTLKNGGTAIGGQIVRFKSIDIPRVYAAAGFDFVFIDMEHTSFTLETVEAMIRVCRDEDIVPIVRVPQAEYPLICRVLDIGAQGIIVPRVSTPEEVRDIVSWTRYPPLGIRGFAATANQTDGQDVDARSFMDAVHRELLLIIQIERKQGLDLLPQMLAVDGVDVACLGYMDLSIDLGLPGDMHHPTMIEAVERLIDVSVQHKVTPGIISPDMDDCVRWMDRGMRFVSFSQDDLLLQQASEQALAKLRAAAGPQPDDDEQTNLRFKAGGA